MPLRFNGSEAIELGDAQDGQFIRRSGNMLIGGDACESSDPRLSDARTPLPHGHAIIDTSGLQIALDGKAATGHTHSFEAAGAVAAHEAAADPHPGYQKETEKNSASGYAGLDISGKLNGAQQVYGAAVNTACQGNDARLSDARIPLAHTHAKADVTDLEVSSVVSAADALVKGNASGKIDTSWLPPGQSGVSQMIVPLVCDAAGVTWTNMPASPAGFFAGSSRFVQKVDLSQYSQCRLTVKKEATAAGAGAVVRLRYRATFDAAVANWLQIGEASVQVPVDSQNTFLDSGWINLVTGAKADVLITLDGLGSNGTLDPAFGSIAAQFR